MGLFSRLPAGAKAVKPRLYQAVDRATSEYLSAPNLAQNMDVVSTINSAVDPTYAANKACKRICLRLRTGNQRVQYVALQLLENCMRSCGEPFHQELSKSDLFNNQLTRMADRSIWCVTEIQRLVLALIQEWAYEIKIPAYSNLFNKLKTRGLPFGPRGLPQDQVFQPYPGLSPPSPGGRTSGQPSSQPGSPGHRENGHRRHHPARTASRGAANLGPDLLRPGRSISDLTSDLQVARGTISLLNEVLDGVEKERNWIAVKEEYCAEVAGACSALKERVTGLIESGIDDEGVVAAAIEVNDDAQRALDRRMMLVEVADGHRQPPAAAPTTTSTTPSDSVSAPAAAAVVENGGAEAAVATTTAAAATAAAATQQQPADNLIDLLDLDWSPSPEPSAAQDPFLPPPPMIPPPMNNPFAATTPAAGGGGHPHVTVESVGGQEQQQSSPSKKDGTPKDQQSGGGGGGGAVNPFLNDDAFAELSLSRGTSAISPSAATAATTPALQQQQQPAKTLSSKPSGNPFASASFDEPSSTSQQLQQAPSFNRPAPLVIPGSTDPIAAGFIPTPGPYTAPPAYYQQHTTTPGSAYPTAPGTGFGAAPLPTAQPSYHQSYSFNAPLPTASAAMGGGGGYGAFSTPQQQQQQQFTPAGHNPYLSAPTPTGSFHQTTPGGGYNPYASMPQQQQKPISDSFKDLVVLKPKKEEAPPPPKGSPMRRGGGSSSASSSVAGNLGVTPQATTPTAAAAANGNGAPARQQQQQNDALSAFDAFDALASGR